MQSVCSAVAIVQAWIVIFFQVIWKSSVTVEDCQSYNDIHYVMLCHQIFRFLLARFCSIVSDCY